VRSHRRQETQHVVLFIQDVHPLSAAQPSLVGEAFTLRYIPAREDPNKLDVFRDRSHPQRKAVEDCPPGAVLVDNRKDARAASAGAILVTRLIQRGVAALSTAGFVTPRRSPASASRLSLPPQRADQPDAAPGDRDHRPDRLRRRAGVSRRRHSRRQ
jgi:Aldolase/RraA